MPRIHKDEGTRRSTISKKIRRGDMLAQEQSCLAGFTNLIPNLPGGNDLTFALSSYCRMERFCLTYKIQPSDLKNGQRHRASVKCPAYIEGACMQQSDDITSFIFKGKTIPPSRYTVQKTTAQTRLL